MDYFDKNYASFLRIIVTAFWDKHVSILNYMRCVIYDAYKGDTPMISFHQYETLLSLIDNLIRILVKEEHNEDLAQGSDRYSSKKAADPTMA